MWRVMMFLKYKKNGSIKINCLTVSYFSCLFKTFGQTLCEQKLNFFSTYVRLKNYPLAVVNETFQVLKKKQRKENVKHKL